MTPSSAAAPIVIPTTPMGLPSYWSRGGGGFGGGGLAGIRRPPCATDSPSVAEPSTGEQAGAIPTSRYAIERESCLAEVLSVPPIRPQSRSRRRLLHSGYCACCDPARLGWPS